MREKYLRYSCFTTNEFPYGKSENNIFFYKMHICINKWCFINNKYLSGK